MTSPLLTIAIPTFNRAPSLEKTLAQLAREMRGVKAGTLDILVCDNSSTDETPVVLATADFEPAVLRVIRNPLNIGSDANIAQCFDQARGRYVHILGDDDLLVDGALRRILGWLENGYGVVYLRAYGFDADFRAEHPRVAGRNREYRDPGAFVVSIAQGMSFISSCIVDRAALPGVDATRFCGSNLVQVHLVLRAALAAERNLYVGDYLIAARRNNSGGYLFARVFVTELGTILDAYRRHGLSGAAIRRLERRLLLSFYPGGLFRYRRMKGDRLAETFERFRTRFKWRPLFWIWVAPTIVLPRPAALLWGGLTMAIGRLLAGDLRRGIAFFRFRSQRHPAGKPPGTP